jgi:hypothetical protein
MKPWSCPYKVMHKESNNTAIKNKPNAVIGAYFQPKLQEEEITEKLL